jgi:hypothetical protein
MFDPEFATKGLFYQASDRVAPTRFHVLGERSSGTNLVKRLLGSNTALAPTEALGWKHGFGQTLAIPGDLVVVCVVRNAVDWARSMHTKPWHSTPQMQALEFADFIRAEWNTVIDRKRYFAGAARMGGLGEVLQHDRDPLTGLAFQDLFALRQAKLRHLLSYRNRGCSLAFLRMESVLSDPKKFVDGFGAAFKLPARDKPFQMVQKRLGSKFKPAIAARPDTPKTLGEDDLAWLKSRLDTEQEALLGYRY